MTQCPLPCSITLYFAAIALRTTIYCAKITTTANNKKSLRANGDFTDKRHPQKVLPTLLRELGINHPDPAAPFARMTYRTLILNQLEGISQAIQR